MIRPTNIPGKTPESDSTLSLTHILGIRGESFARIRMHSAEIAVIATHVEALDVALQTNADCRSIDESQALVTVVRNLAALLADGSAVAP